MSSPQAPILQALLWDSSFPWGPVLQEQITPVWVPHGTTDPDRNVLLQRLSTTCSLPQGISTCSINGSPMAHRVDTCSTMVLHGLKGLSHHSLGPANLFLSHILSPLSQLLLHSIFYPFLNMLSMRWNHCHWLAQLRPEAGPSWTLLELQYGNVQHGNNF